MMYTNAVAMVQINGLMLGPIPICFSIRQGCPLSMELFALCQSADTMFGGKPSGTEVQQAAKVSGRSGVYR
jgi:xanthosine utilization system XapX-like protein